MDRTFQTMTMPEKASAALAAWHEHMRVRPTPDDDSIDELIPGVPMPHWNRGKYDRKPARAARRISARVIDDHNAVAAALTARDTELKRLALVARIEINNNNLLSGLRCQARPGNSDRDRGRDERRNQMFRVMADSTVMKLIWITERVDSHARKRLFVGLRSPFCKDNFTGRVSDEDNTETIDP
jgi:hypothetical protein